jgi:putative DNA methylase
MQSFIEVQFPVSKVSKESYKERMSNYSQTLTGLGKWWGRKPLILVRATLLGLLMPASDKPERDREIFLKILTMDAAGMRARKDKKIAAKKLIELVRDNKHERKLRQILTALKSQFKIGQIVERREWRVDEIVAYFFDEPAGKWRKEISKEQQQAFELAVFDALTYDEKLDYCRRPEQIDGPQGADWQEINAHLGTTAKNLTDLFRELGRKRFGHDITVGDAFCGGGSIPFEAARMGLNVYASDLNPVAALLTWAALNIVGGGSEVAAAVKKAQEEVYAAVDQQVTEWGIEHNELGHRADAYLYCVEVSDPETGYQVPLAPSWVIGEKTRTVALLKADEKHKRYDITIKMDATEAEMQKAKLGTVQNGNVVHAKGKNPVPMTMIRRESEGGLRQWENSDTHPRPGDVFQERLYCIRYVIPSYRERMRYLAAAAARPGNEQVKMQLMPLGDEEIKKIKKDTKLDLKGYTHIADNYAVRKVLKDHGDTVAEAKRGQLAVTPEAIELIPWIVAEYDTVTVSEEKNKRGLTVLLFEKKFNGVVFYVSEVRTGQKQLALNTMYIRRGRVDAELPFDSDPAPSSETSPPAAAEGYLHGVCQQIFASASVLRAGESRYYQAPDKADLAREDKVLALLAERFAEWQKQGFIPSKKIEPGEKTDEPIRTRGWTHWHHLFNPRQLLVNGLIMERNFEGPKSVAVMLSTGKCLDYNARLTRWTVAAGSEKTDNVFSNQAFNTLANYGVRSLLSSQDNLRMDYKSSPVSANAPLIQTISAVTIETHSDIWITDPPYADAVNYHELTEFFLAWYEKHIPKLFPEWYADSKRALAITGRDESFRHSMVEAYRNLAEHMPADGMQVVMFTHQDAAVWADLTLILWAAGLKVSSAWTIATETSSALKEGNYVQGTVLLILRKQESDKTGFLSEVYPQIEDEVRRQIDSMHILDDKEEPNFADTDYQLAAYAAALRVLTQYQNIQDIDVEQELARPREKNAEPTEIEKIIYEAVRVASSVLVPEGLDANLWRDLSPEERFYLRGLEIEMHGEYRAGAYSELAKGFGVKEYKSFQAVTKANQTRLKNASEFASRAIEPMGKDKTFACSQLRHLLYAIFVTADTLNAEAGKAYLRENVTGYWQRRALFIDLLTYLHKLSALPHHKKDAEAAWQLAILLREDSV